MSARRPGGAAAGTPAKRRPWLRSTLVRASHGQRRTIPFPSGPMQAGDHAATGPRRHINRLDPTGGGPPHRATPGPTRRGQRGGSAADTAGLSVRTPGCTGRLDTGRPLERLDEHPHDGTRDADRATTGLAGVRTSSRPATTRWAARPRPGHGAWEPSATQDGSAVTAPAPRPDRRRHGTAAQHRPGMRPRPGALLSSDDFGSSVER